MCRSCGQRHNSVVTDTSPGGQGQDGSLDSLSRGSYAHGGTWRGGSSGGGGGVSSAGGGAPGCGSLAAFTGGSVISTGIEGGERGPGLTMKEYDQHLSRLSMENFQLKLRVFYSEQGQQTGQSDGQLRRANVDLKVENESLKRQVYDKQQLLTQASVALGQIEEDYKEQLAAIVEEHDGKTRRLHQHLHQLQQTVDQYSSRCQELEAALRQHQLPRSNPPVSELSQLCDLAFPTTDTGCGATATTAAAAAANGGEDPNTMDLWSASEGPSMWGTAPPTSSAWGPSVTSPFSGVVLAVDKMAPGSHAGGGLDGADSNISSSNISDAAAVAVVEQQGRKLSTDSQGSQINKNNSRSSSSSNNSSSNNDDGCCVVDSSSTKQQQQPPPVQHITTTTNVTNNNINNTQPSNSNTLHQMQQQQQQPAAAAAAAANTELSPQDPADFKLQQHHHHYHHLNSEQQQHSAAGVASCGAAAVAAPAAAVQSPLQLQVQQEQPQQPRAGGEEAALLPLSKEDACSGACLLAHQRLQEQVAALQDKLDQLQRLLQQKEQLTTALQEDIDNLNKELAEKESELQEREEKVDSLSQQLETRHRQLQNREDTIVTLHSDLNRVEPEISVKVQEIVERDRTIEEKIEQIEQQNKILVEIQITLDEKQKQIAELEASLARATERVSQLERDYDKSCSAINGFIADVSSRDLEIASLTKENKRRERKIRDLVAELKETLDMLDKAKWEAETGGCREDSVKDMAEEENERLWAEMEQKKDEVTKLRSDLSRAAEETAALTRQLAANEEAEQRWRQEVDALTAAVSSRQEQLDQHNHQVLALTADLAAVKAELEEKQALLCRLQAHDTCHQHDNSAQQHQQQQPHVTDTGHQLTPLAPTSIEQSASRADTAHQCLLADGAQQQLELEKLRHKLEICEAARVKEVDALKEQLQQNNSDLQQLRKLSSAAGGAAPMMALVPQKQASDGLSCDRTAMRYDQLQLNITAGVMSSAGAAVTRPGVGGSSSADSDHHSQSLAIEDPEAASVVDPGGVGAKSCDENSDEKITNGGTDSKRTKNCLEEDKEDNSISVFQRQIEKLRLELNDMKKLIGSELSEIGSRSRLLPLEVVRKYRSECSRLRRRLGDSNKSCELLQVRLQELAEFLEQILELDERGLIDLSQLTGLTRSHLCQSLNDSRALSQTLSQSMLAELEDSCLLEEADDDLACHSLGPEESMYYLDDHDSTAASANMTIASSVTRNESFLAAESGYQQLSDRLCQEVESKASQLDGILQQVALISADVSEKEVRAFQQAQVIATLTDEVRQLKEGLKAYELASLEKDREPDSWQEVACQTLLAMAPTQSISSPPPHISDWSETGSLSTASMEPVIEEASKSADGSEASDEEEEMNPSRNVNAESRVATSKLLSLLTCGDNDLVSSLPSDSRQHQAVMMKSGCVSGGTAPHVPASPSESEAWSEPDRNVSLARIGLETCSLAASLDRSTSRSRQTRASAALSSESDTEGCAALVEEAATSVSPSTLVGTAAKCLPRRKLSNLVLVLSTRLRDMDELNASLKAELNLLHVINNSQLSTSTDPQQSDDHKPSSSCSRTPGSGSQQDDSPRLTPGGRKQQRRSAQSGEDSLNQAAKLLPEIRDLRNKLEQSILNNNQLRQQLEAAVQCCKEPTNVGSLSMALLNVQETLQLTREKLAFAERCEQVQADRCSLAERQTDEKSRTCEQLQQQLLEAQQQAEAAEAKFNQQLSQLKEQCSTAESRLAEALHLHEESETSLQQRLLEVTRACEESESRLQQQHEAINAVYASLREVGNDDVAASGGGLPHLSHLHAALQASETQVLRVTRDRLALLGEKSKLQAQLMSAQAQTSLLQDSLCEEEEAGDKQQLLHLQLSRVQSAVKSLQDECSRLRASSTALSCEKERLLEQLAGYRAVERLGSKSDITLEAVGGNESSRLTALALQQVQKKHSLLQEDYTHLQNDYTHLQRLYNVLQEDEKKTCQSLHLAQLSLDTLGQQYQERVLSLQRECSEKLQAAEKQVMDVQERFQERMVATEERLTEVQRKSQHKVAELKRDADELSRTLNAQLRQLLQQLDTERKSSAQLRLELQLLRQQAPSLPDNNGAWSDNKENLHSGLSLNLQPPSAVHNTSPLKSPGLALSTGPVHSLSHSNLSAFSRSPGRRLHFSSDPSLGALYTESNSLGGLTYAEEEDEQEGASDSPDLGLGSSDNGQLSSLEGVSSSSSSSVRRGAAQHSTAAPAPGYLLSHEHSRHSSTRGSLGALNTSSSSQQPIGVVISGRSSLPPAATGPLSDQLCAVTSHSCLASSNRELLLAVQSLQEELHSKDAHLMEARNQLKAANARKQTVERAICRQLSKTHQVLRQAKGNLQHHRGGPDPTTTTTTTAGSAQHQPSSLQ